QSLHAAEERCRRILANASSCVKALLILAAIEQAAGHLEEAQRLVRTVTELDPEQRIAQVLFADRLATRHRNLRLLLFGEERATIGSYPPGRAPAPSAPSPAQMGTRTPQWSRPLVDQRSADPFTGSSAQPLAASSPSSGALPGAAYATGGPLSE